ncbi:MAG: helix-turn-helix domain-containing protein [Bacteroidota bacterium]
MRAKTPNERIIFGLKVKQLRQAQQKSFADLSAQTGMSVSYLNEIEKGKKYPKADKVAILAAKLNTTAAELTSGELGRHLAPVQRLLRSNFLNDLPLELFGIELNKVAEIIANSPAQVGAFISTLLELSRTHSVHEENFYFGALRSYLELHNNYFQEIEDAVVAFCEKYNISADRPLGPRQLATLLENNFKYTIVPEGLDHESDLKSFRSVFIPERRHLLLNSKLKSYQRAFQFGKELAFNAMQLKERAPTSRLLRVRSFEEVLNHSKATYFSVALLMPLEPFIEDVRHFFALPHWDAQAWEQIMQRYNATPEMFYHRLTNIMPQFLGMSKLFFLRFLHDPAQDEFSIDRELHLSDSHHPHGNALYEHYCRRWVSVALLKDLKGELAKQGDVASLISVQRSRYYGTSDEYLCITIARPGYPSPKYNVSVTLGLLINDDVRKQVKWLEDPKIPFREVNTTCERCPIMDCAERAAEPSVVNKRERYRKIQEALIALE